MNNLDRGYTTEVDSIGKAEWHSLLADFADANIYQTWSYGEVAWGSKQLSHLILRRDGRPAAMAQLRIMQLPIFQKGIAYLNWGPLWLPRFDSDHLLCLKNMIRALRNEYVSKRGLILRMQPKIIEDADGQRILSLFREEGFLRTPDPMRTFLVDLRPSIEDLRKNLHRSWRRSLTFAEKQGLILEEAKAQEHYDLILKIYSQLKARKKFFGNMQLDMLEVHKDLPSELKLKIMLCKERGEAVSVLGWSNIGNICYPLIGATGDRGLIAKASFLLWWEMVRAAKAHQAAYCDTATVHEKRNPGGHFFKQGLAGKAALETRYLGRFDAHRNLLAYGFLRTALGLREKIVNTARRIKIWSRRDRSRDSS